MNRPYYRRPGYRYPYPYPAGFTADYAPVVVEKSGSDCSCGTGSGFEQKIKENPLVFVIGALLVGYLFAKNK